MTVLIPVLSSFTAFQIPFVDTALAWAPIAVAVLVAVGVVGLCVLAAFVLALASVKRGRTA